MKIEAKMTHYSELIQTYTITFTPEGWWARFRKMKPYTEEYKSVRGTRDFFHSEGGMILPFGPTAGLHDLLSKAQMKGLIEQIEKEIA